MHSQRRRAELGDAIVEYGDTGGGGVPLVLLHGALMDDGLWRGTCAGLPGGIRCITPVLPMGAHRVPLPANVDVSPRGIARLVAGLLDHLNLAAPILVGNDTGGAIAQLVLADRPERVGGVVLISCDAFDNFPPGLPGRTMALAAKLPGGLRAAMTMLRWPAMRRLPMTFGWMARRPIDRDLFSRWLNAFDSDPGVRRNVRQMMAGVDRVQLCEAAEQLRSYSGPALIAWAADDRVMPRSHAERLAAMLPNGRLELISDSYTLVPLDQPAALTELITAFVERDYAERNDSGTREGEN